MVFLSETHIPQITWMMNPNQPFFSWVKICPIKTIDVRTMVLNCRAKSDLDSYMIVSHEWGHFCDSLDNKKIIQAPFCGDEDCEDKIKKDSAR